MLSRRLRSSPVARAASLGVFVAILVALPGCSTIRSMMPEEEAGSFQRSVTNPEVRAMVNRYLAVRMKT